MKIFIDFDETTGEFQVLHDAGGQESVATLRRANEIMVQLGTSYLTRPAVAAVTGGDDD